MRWLLLTATLLCGCNSSHLTKCSDGSDCYIIYSDETLEYRLDVFIKTCPTGYDILREEGDSYLIKCHDKIR